MARSYPRSEVDGDLRELLKSFREFFSTLLRFAAGWCAGRRPILCRQSVMIWIHLRRLKGDDGGVRARAAHALAEGGSRKAVEPLGEALGDLSWAERSAAAMALGKLGNGRAIPFLSAALCADPDPDVDVRCGAAWALGRIGSEAVFEALTAALDDDDETVRRAAAEALTKVGTLAALEGLTRALRDPHHDVRLAAVRGLGEVGSGKIASDLLAALDDSEWSVRCAAAESLSKLGDSGALPALLEALANGSVAGRLAASEALGRIGDPRAIEPLAALLEQTDSVAPGPDTPDLRLRRNVAKALGDIGTASGLPGLRALSGDAHTAGAAIEALVKVLRWDAANAERSDLEVLAEIDDPNQVPWMIDEAEEAATGRVVVREGKAWSVDATGLRALALAEIRRRDKDG